MSVCPPHLFWSLLTHPHWALCADQRDGLTFCLHLFCFQVEWKTKLTIWTLFPSNACIILVMCLVHTTTLSPFIPTLCIAFHPLVPWGSMSPDTHIPRIVLACTVPGLCVPILPAGHIPSLTYWVSSLCQPENPDLSPLLYASFKVPGL